MISIGSFIRNRYTRELAQVVGVDSCESVIDLKLSHEIARFSNEEIKAHWEPVDFSNNIPTVVQKRWGTEYICSRSPYGCKIMTIYPTSKISCHFHVDKTETFILVEGQLVIDITDLKTGLWKKVHLTNKYDHVTLKPYEAHTFYCPEGQTENTVFIESSSEDKDSDNYRFTLSKGPENTDIR